jgi:hypothetical protein
VWAFEQEEQKLLTKWHRIQQPPSDATAHSATTSSSHVSDSACDVACDGPPDSCAARPCNPSSDGDSSHDSSTDGSLDYMVPWHLPFHRLEAAAVAARTVRVSPDSSLSQGDDAAPRAADPTARTDSGCNGAASTAPSGIDSRRNDSGSRSPAFNTSGGSGITSKPFARIDAVKNTIVFDRYYHLFREGELEQLAAQVPGTSIADAFYDKSNWCIVMQRDAAASGSAGTCSGKAAPSIL